MLDDYYCEVLRDFVVWLSNQEFTEHTKRIYVSRVKGFFFFVSQRFESERGSEAWANWAREYAEFLRMDAQIRPATINDIVVAVRQFLYFKGLDAQLVKQAPFSKTEARTTATAEEHKIYSHIERVQWSRDRLILLLLLDAGLTISECVSLIEQNVYVGVDGSKCIMTIRRRSRYGSAECGTRTIELKSIVAAAMVDWLRERSDLLRCCGRNADELLLSRQGQAVSVGAIDYVVRYFGWKIGLVLSAQKLRAIFLHKLVTTGMPLEQVSALTGIESHVALMRYSGPLQ